MNYSNQLTRMAYYRIVLTIAGLLIALLSFAQKNALVFQTDFGLKDGAVAAMKGVAFGVSPELPLFDLTHEIPAYNVWEAAYRLEQTAAYWPAGTVFVSVVDPGVGTERKSVVLKTKTGHYFVSPDNGTLTLVAQSMGIDEIREINEATNRRKNSGKSYTFHGRDVYAFTAAKLAAGNITFNAVGKKLPKQVVSLPHAKATFAKGTVTGMIPVLDVQYGNVWTNIDADTFNKLGVRPGDKVKIKITHGTETRYEGEMPYAHTFGDVPVAANLCYLNSLLQVSFGINQGNFSAQHQVFSGAEWRVEVWR